MDDMTITGKDKKKCLDFRSKLATDFEMKNLGGLKYFLGIEVTRSGQGIFLCNENIF